MNGIALVTGAGQGIGKAVADRLIADGWETVYSDLSLQNAEASAGDARKKGGAAHAWELNVAEFSAIKAAVEDIESSVGPIGCLINCAGICLTRPFFDIDEAGFEKTFQVNVKGLFFTMQAVAAKMSERLGGAVVNIASVSGFMPKLEQLDYGASKAAVISMTRSAAASLGPLGIRVNAVAPGVIDTPLTQSIAQTRAKIRGVSPLETLQPVIDHLPLRRIGMPEEVANAVSFLVSDEASYITGQTIDVCGGQWMR